MAGHHHQQFIPRSVLIGAGALIAATILLVGFNQYRKSVSPPEPGMYAGVTALDQRLIEFSYNARGEAISVFDAETGEKIDDLAANDGFVRTVLMSMAFNRNRDGVEGEPVFRLTRWEDSRLSIEDLDTGIIINLGAFGPGNKAVFERFLPSG